MLLVSCDLFADVVSAIHDSDMRPWRISQGLRVDRAGAMLKEEITRFPSADILFEAFFRFITIQVLFQELLGAEDVAATAPYVATCILQHAFAAATAHG